MKIVVPRERRPGETRVAASPETVRKFAGLGVEIIIETGAGQSAAMLDTAYEAAGARIVGDVGGALGEADAILKVQRPQADEIAQMRPGAVLACLMAPHADRDTVRACAERGLTVFAMEFVPRITRAQSMDVLSSQANLAGYRAVIEGAAQFARAFPMMMTAAGTVPPAKVFVLGAGVAGLQAIATARRLGAVVSATDVRRAAGEQVESLGAKFVFIDLAEDMETKAGYARELSDEDKRRQSDLVANHVKNQDLVITTALIPGRPAPLLITREMVESMRPGAVIVDLATEAGGNCESSRKDEIVKTANGVTIVGWSNLPAHVAVDASALYARNMLHFLTPMIDKESKALAPDWEDEIVRGAMIARDGRIVHPALAESAGPVEAEGAAAG
jgi:NAD(P) transhydrogenase subunit alpha